MADEYDELKESTEKYKRCNVFDEKYLDSESLYDMADLFRCFSDSTRVRILCSLFQKERNVTEIASLLNMTTSAISHQLQILRASRLVKARRDGKTVFYALADDHVKTIFYQALEHISEL